MNHTPDAVGLESLGLALPTYAIDLTTFAEACGADPAKYLVGLGCQRMSIARSKSDVVELGVRAARRAIESWGGDPQNIGVIAVGTETSLDESRPLSAFIAESLGLHGAVRSYEVKHGCYGGTLALRQAMEWRRASVAPLSKVALVIAADVCHYAPFHPAEATQGAGAAAMIVGEPRLCTLHPQTYAYSRPIFDFFRPTGDPFPTVDGKKSFRAYCEALEFTTRLKCRTTHTSPTDLFQELYAFCLHVPFPRMVIKACQHLGQIFGLAEDEVEHLIAEKVRPFLGWNTQIGNAYTASLWISLAQALCAAPAESRIGLFSYGSGCGAELFGLTVASLKDKPWERDMEAEFAAQHLLSAADYRQWRT